MTGKTNSEWVNDHFIPAMEKQMTYEHQRALMEAQRNDSVAKLSNHLTSTREVAIYEAGFVNGWVRCKREHKILDPDMIVSDIVPDNSAALAKKSDAHAGLRYELNKALAENERLRNLHAQQLPPDTLARIVLAVTEAVDNDDSLSPSWEQAEAIGSAIQVAIFAKVEP